MQEGNLLFSITDIQTATFPLPRDYLTLDKNRRFFVTISDGRVTKHTQSIPLNQQSLRWSETLDGFAVDPSSQVVLKVLEKHEVRKDNLLATFVIPYEILRSEPRNVVIQWVDPSKKKKTTSREISVTWSVPLSEGVDYGPTAGPVPLSEGVDDGPTAGSVPLPEGVDDGPTAGSVPLSEGVDYGPTAEELQKGSLIVLADMKTLTGVNTSDVALIGGQAVIHYIGRLRTTKDIDVLTTAKGAPKAVKSQLLKHFADRYRQVSEKFEVDVDGHWIQVDLVAADMFGPTGPSVTNLISMTKVERDTMPWAGVVDLIVMKMFAVPIRPEMGKRQTDLSDLDALLAYAKRNPAQADYTERQREWVKQEMDDELFKGVKADLRAVFKL